MGKEKKITVKELLKIIADFKVEGKINDKTEIWLASDEEGNSMSPLMQFKSGLLNVGVSLKSLTLYPSSMHSTDSVEEDI